MAKKPTGTKSMAACPFRKRNLCAPNIVKREDSRVVTLGQIIKMRGVMDTERKRWFHHRGLGKHVARRVVIGKDQMRRAFDDFEFTNAADADAFVDCKVVAAGLESIGFKVVEGNPVKRK